MKWKAIVRVGGKALDSFAITVGIVRARRRVWWTLWLFPVRESDRSLRKRIEARYSWWIDEPAQSNERER